MMIIIKIIIIIIIITFWLFTFDFAIFFGFICLFQRKMPTTARIIIYLLKGEMIKKFERFN